MFCLENLLNTSRCQNISTETPVLRQTYAQQDESINDERHERTGSVKFADQAEENKEV